MMHRNQVAQETPFFSIIVPVYKTEQYIQQCIESVLNQTFRDFELILVDDGSPDSSGAICDKYAEADARVCVIHKENGGLVSARKAGAAICRGCYIINVDSDDYIAEELLARLTEVIQENDPDLVIYDLMQFSDDSRMQLQNLLEPGLYEAEQMDYVRDNLMQNDRAEQMVLYNLCAMAVKREKYLVFQNTVPETISRGEDLVVSTPLINSCERIYFLRFFGYFYRSNPASIMNTFRLDEVDQIKQVVSYLSDVMGKDYQRKLDVYTLSHYFDFLDRGMCNGSYKDYRMLIRNTLDEELMQRIRRARCCGGIKLQLIFALMRHQCFTILWLLRKIKKRNSKT